MITKQQFENALEWSYSTPNQDSIDKILSLHQENKKPLLSKMGDWIIDYGLVELAPTEKDIEQGYKYFLHDIKSFRWMASTDEERDELEEVIRYVEENKDGFYTNRVMYGPQRGMKLTKAIGLLLKSSPMVANELQIQYSKRKPVNNTGNFKMSIHGMDFITMSENNYDWHSCMALDGEYAAGTLSYMCDNCSVVLYLDGSRGDLRKLPCCNEPWNDKKWRMMAYVDLENNRIYLGGKQYPYKNSMLEDMAIEKLKEVFLPNASLVDYSDKSKDKPFHPYYDNVGNHYNDFCLNSERNDAKILYDANSIVPFAKKFIIGSDVPCFCCGSNPIQVAGDWLCYECGDYHECIRCGEWFGPDDFWSDHDMCSWCVDESLIYCDCCNEYVGEDDYDDEFDCCYSCVKNREED